MTLTNMIMIIMIMVMISKEDYSFIVSPQRGSDLAKIDAADRALEDEASPESHPVTQITP